MLFARFNQRLQNIMRAALMTGWQKIDSRMRPTHIRQHESCAHNFGPQSSDPITNGLSENLMRPVHVNHQGAILHSTMSTQDDRTLGIAQADACCHNLTLTYRSAVVGKAWCWAPSGRSRPG